MIEQIPMIGSMALGYGETTPPNPSSGEGQELKEACKDFVAILYAYTFEQLRSTNEDNEEGLFNGQETSMFMGFLDQEIGKNIANREGGELPDLLYQQLTNQYKIDKK